MAKRGRPAGSKNKNKAAASAPPAAGSQPGHNSGLTEAEKQNRLIIGLTEIEKHKKAAESENAKARNERKRLESVGFKSFEIDFGLKLRKEKDEESVDTWNRMRRIAAFLNHPIGTQNDIFDRKDQTDEDRADVSGETAGLEGKECKPPYDAASDLGQRWIAAWHVGNAKRNSAMASHVNGNASDAAAESFDHSMPETDGEGKPFHEVLREQNNEVEGELRRKANVSSDDDGQPPEIPDDLKRASETA